MSDGTRLAAARAIVAAAEKVSARCASASIAAAAEREVAEDGLRIARRMLDRLLDATPPTTIEEAYAALLRRYPNGWWGAALGAETVITNGNAMIAVGAALPIRRCGGTDPEPTHRDLRRIFDEANRGTAYTVSVAALREACAAVAGDPDDDDPLVLVRVGEAVVDASLIRAWALAFALTEGRVTVWTSGARSAIMLAGVGWRSIVMPMRPDTQTACVRTLRLVAVPL